MSSSDRRSVLVLLAALPALAACGFTPAYAPGGPALALRGAVRADEPSDRDGFDFVKRLEERLGRPETARYALGYTITTQEIGVGLQPDNTTTRYNLTGKAAWRLLDAGTGAELASGTVDSFTSYNTTGTTVSALTAEADAHARLMRILADQVVTRLIATAPGLTP